MDKPKIFLLILLAIALLLTACTPAVSEESTLEPTQTQPPTKPEPTLSPVVLQVSGACHPSDGGNHAYDYEYWTVNTLNSRNRPEAPRTMTVTFYGADYTGQYNGSYVNAPNTYTIDKYRTDTESFEVNSQTGQLVSISLHSALEETQEEKTEEECEAIARELMVQYADANQYTLETATIESAYIFTYVRYIDGLKTNDSYHIAVSKTGRIKNFSCFGGGSFSTEQLSLTQEAFTQQLAFLQSEPGQHAVVEKTETIYADFHTVYPDPKAFYEYVIKPQYLVVLPDGTLGMYYHVDVDVEVPKENNLTMTCGSTLQLVVKCQPSDLPMPESDPPENMPAQIATGKDAATGVSLSAYRLSPLSVNYEQIYGDEYKLLPEDTYAQQYNQEALKEVFANPYPYYGGFTGQYTHSLQFPQENRLLNCYNDGFHSFSVDAETGELMAVQSSEWHAGQETVESCRDKADGIAGKFGDLSQWEQSRSAVGELYRYVYYRYVPEEQICHWITVTLDSDRGLYSFFRGSLALPEGTENTYLPQVQALLSDQGYALFTEKQKEATDIMTENILLEAESLNYDNAPLPAREEFYTNCAIYSMDLLILPDGSLGALYNTYLQICSENSVYSNQVNFLIKCA